MIAHTPLDFIVLAYPRSGTTWLSNWLTTDRSLCLHDPWAHGTPDLWPGDARIRGISCTGSFMLGDWVARQGCPVAVIERDRADCNRSLTAAGLGSIAATTPIPELDDINGRRFAFADLWTESGARALWAYLLPTIPFDAIRYRLLRDIQVQPVASALIPSERMLASIRAMIQG